MNKYHIFFSFIIAVLVLSSMTIDLQNLFNYSNQEIPTYITKDNTGTNSITDEGATLGRVLFYDKKLSSNNTIACASCHHQEFAFGDTSLVSVGVNGVTGRHSMRLVNNRFADEAKYFWDERASTLEDQSTMPIMDHVEMGYSGTNGDPEFGALITKLDTVPYYDDLFFLAFGDTNITQQRMQLALAQFIRSIQSFDSPYDVGRAQVSNDSVPFPNFSPQQNDGKELFLTPAEFNNNGMRIGGGLGCANCHRAPEFDIVPDSKSNGVIFTPGNTNPNGVVDPVVFKSPSLRDIVDENGNVNGNLMHTGNFVNLTNVLNHYDRINLFPQVDNIAEIIDDRLLPNGRPQDLNMTNQERNRVINFLGTLTGTDIYTNEKWSDPFDENGNLELLNSPLTTSNETVDKINFTVFPNPIQDDLNLQGNIENTVLEIYNLGGSLLNSVEIESSQATIPFGDYPAGTYILVLTQIEKQFVTIDKVIKL